MNTYQSNRIPVRHKLRRWVLLLSAIVFLWKALVQGLALNSSAFDSRITADQGAPLGPVLARTVFLPTLPNVISLRKTMNNFFLMHCLADNRVAYERYIAINPLPGPVIFKPGHHRQAFLYLDLPPPACHPRLIPFQI